MFRLKLKTKKHFYRIFRDRMFIEWCIKKLLHVTLLSRWFVVKRKYYMAYVHHDPFSLWMWLYPAQTRADEVFFADYCKPGDVVIDVGANVGIITLTALGVIGNKGEVHAFEPHPHTCAYLRRNITLYRGDARVCVYNMAVGNSVGATRILNHYVKDINHIVEQGGISTAMTTLDACIPQQKIHVLKIDAEGYELFVLQGASRTLEHTECVFVEYSPKTYARFGYSFSDVYTLLFNAGFALYIQDKNKNLVPIDTTFSAEQKYMNVIAFRDVGTYYNRMRQA